MWMLRQRESSALDEVLLEHGEGSRQMMGNVGIDNQAFRRQLPPCRLLLPERRRVYREHVPMKEPEVLPRN